MNNKKRIKGGNILSKTFLLNNNQKETLDVCPICNKEIAKDDEYWVEFEKIYHIKCLRDLEKKGTPFSEKYTNQKRLTKEQVLGVFDLLNDKEFLEYWIHIVACESDECVEKIYEHPILKEFDLLP